MTAIEIAKRTRQTAIVDHTATYAVEKAEWDTLIADGMTPDEALEKIQGNYGAILVSAVTEMGDSITVHDTEVEEA